MLSPRAYFWRYLFLICGVTQQRHTFPFQTGYPSNGPAKRFAPDVSKKAEYGSPMPWMDPYLKRTLKWGRCEFFQPFPWFCWCDDLFPLWKCFRSFQWSSFFDSYLTVGRQQENKPQAPRGIGMNLIPRMTNGRRGQSGSLFWLLSWFSSSAVFSLFCSLSTKTITVQVYRMHFLRW